MPKKTKKEKIIALYRKKLKLLKEIQPTISLNQTKKNEEKNPPTTIINKPKLKITLEQNQNKEEKTSDFFLKDLKKSLILTGLMIALEIFIYFVRIVK